MWIFPEGTRNKNVLKSGLLPFKKGAFRIAIENQVPILPIVYSPYYFINEKNHYFGRGINRVDQNICTQPSPSYATLDENLENITCSKFKIHLPYHIEIDVPPCQFSKLNVMNIKIMPWDTNYISKIVHFFKQYHSIAGKVIIQTLKAVSTEGLELADVDDLMNRCHKMMLEAFEALAEEVLAPLPPTYPGLRKSESSQPRTSWCQVRALTKLYNLRL